MKFLFKKRAQLLLISIIAVSFRAYNLLNRGTFWFDELFSVKFSSLPWLESLKLWTLETNPPLYMLFLRGYLKIINENKEWLIRMPSMIFGLSAIILLYFFSKQMFGKKNAIYSSLLLSLSGLHIFISSEARGYSMFILLVLLSNYLFYQIFFTKKQTVKYWIYYTIINTLAIYTHLTSLTIPLIHFLTLIILRPGKNTIKYWAISVCATILLWTPWFIPWFGSKFNSATASAWFFASSANLQYLLSTPFVDSIIPFTETLITLLVIAGICFISNKIRQTASEEKNKLIFISLCAVLPIFISSLINVFVPKYVIFTYPFIYILTAYVLERAAKTKKGSALIAAMVIILMLPTAITAATAKAARWDMAANYIEKNENDKTLIMVSLQNALAFDRYYKGKSPIIKIYLKNDALSDNERLVLYNWSKQFTTEEELTRWIFVNIKKYNAEKLFLVDNTTTIDWMEKILIEHGWNKVFKKQSQNTSNKYVLAEYDSPPQNHNTSAEAGFSQN